MTNPTTTEMAWRLRQRGLIPMPHGNYVDPRVNEIVQRQTELNAEFEKLDLELKALANKEK